MALGERTPLTPPGWPTRSSVTAAATTFIGLRSTTTRDIVHRPALDDRTRHRVID